MSDSLVAAQRAMEAAATSSSTDDKVLLYAKASAYAEIAQAEYLAGIFDKMLKDSLQSAGFGTSTPLAVPHTPPQPWGTPTYGKAKL